MTEQRIILLTGCSSGIGAYCARALKADGWRVFATVRNEADLAPLASDGIEALLLDYTRPETISAAVATIRERTADRIDALFNNGAYGQPGAVEDLTTDVLREQFETNVFGWHELTRQVLPLMRKQGHGRIVNCSSILGLVPYRFRGAYTASKFALEGLTITLRMELQGSGIHVSLIEPGPIATKFTANALAKIREHIDLEGSAHAVEYRRQLKRLDGSGPINKHKLGPEAVYHVLKLALNVKSPRPHYLVTTPAKQGVLLKRLLPANLFYRLMRRLD
ncbi:MULTISPECIES: SDR family oxidoreductase [unclassified Rhizobium]|uniref:SDR family oxidoreductase n=1 Tax=unclassified Rhizobium TaxID=2613769 RepID=UPI0016154BD5|nr:MULTISPECIES: SDR family oxidoreductase [unclassified Rhizobium]MBB3286731.1 NAD(P)-dependent dehydrogenase (short-subunit alcohol dehydrogenase family) [Rhizobium sp. BK252]MBB3401075.1 NAD(P)-dependent dehydrogenase (short-subunit alcohol dehydrogenase family) [Rhizobium sp. BK289]MBB3413653.1 NAD(P)-dependent dehydrogenase (short-subunit alcohol dehydrogenase family) [Rhizobium sp. BK284]MBB3481540.1 NAD(P)-dependent dehydrogenase (short-subunit alcohol dehydrogenase family) [Rhizobium sp